MNAAGADTFVSGQEHAEDEIEPGGREAVQAHGEWPVQV